MKTAPAAIALLSAGLVSLIAGCASSSPDDEFDTTPPSSEVMTRKANQTKMDRASVPQAVRGAFAVDFPGAAIDNVRLVSTAAGEPFYQITFIKNGQAQSTRYFPNGARVRR